MANRGAPFDIYVRGTNTSSGAIKQAGNDLQQLGKQGRLTSIELFSIGFILRDVNRGLQQFSRQIIDTAKDVASMTMDFETDMRRVQTQITNNEMSFGELSNSVLQMSRDVEQSTSELADGMFDIFSSMDVGGEAATKMVERLAKAATAGFTDIETVGRGAISMMNAFGMVTGDTEQDVANLNHVLDVQFRMVELGIGEYEDFAGALGNIIPSAAAAGQSIEELGALMAFTTRQGLNTRKASVSIARALDLLTRPKIIQGMKEVFNIDVIDQATGRYRQMSEVIGDMAKEFEGMTEPEIMNSLGKVFGQGEIRAMRFFKVAIPNFKELAEMVKRFSGDEVQGSMMRAFDKAAQATSIQLAILKNNFSALVKTFGLEFLPGINKGINLLDKFVDALHDLDPEVKSNIANLTAFAAGLVLITTGLTTIIGMWARWASLMKLSGIEIASVVTWLGRLITVASGLGLILAAIVTNWDMFSGALEGVGPSVQDLLEALAKLGNEVLEALLPAIAELVRVVAVGLVPVIKAVTSVLTPLLNAIADSELAVTALAIALGVMLALRMKAAIASIIALSGRFDMIALAAYDAAGAIGGAISAHGFVGALKLAVTNAGKLVASLGRMLLAINPIITAIAVLGVALYTQIRSWNEYKRSVAEALDVIEESEGFAGLKDELEEVDKKLQELIPQTDNYKQALKEVSEQTGSNYQDIRDYGEEVDKLREKKKQLEDRLGPLADRTEGYGNTLAATSSRAVEAATNFQVMSDEVAETVQKLHDAAFETAFTFDSMAEQAKQGLGELQAAMAENTAFLNTYVRDLEVIALSGNEALAEGLRQMGPAGAAAARQAAEAILSGEGLGSLPKDVQAMLKATKGLSDLELRKWEKNFEGQAQNAVKGYIGGAESLPDDLRPIVTDAMGEVTRISQDGWMRGKKITSDATAAMTATVSNNFGEISGVVRTTGGHIKGFVVDANGAARDFNMNPAAMDAAALAEALNIPIEDARTLKRELDSLDGKRTRSSHTHTTYRVEGGSGFRGSALHAGGLIRHFGGPIPSFQFGGAAREVPALLEAGEFVLRRDAVEALGLPFLRRLNNMRVGQRDPQRQAPQPIQVPSRSSGEGPTFHIQGRFETPEELVDALEWQHLTRGW